MCGCDGGILVGILLHDILIPVLDKTEDRIISRICLSDELAAVSVYNVGLGKDKLAVGHKPLLDDILDIFNEHSLSVLGFDASDDLLDLLVRDLLTRLNLRVSLLDSQYDLASVVRNSTTVSLDNLHFPFSLCVM